MSFIRPSSKVTFSVCHEQSKGEPFDQPSDAINLSDAPFSKSASISYLLSSSADAAAEEASAVFAELFELLPSEELSPQAAIDIVITKQTRPMMYFFMLSYPFTIIYVSALAVFLVGIHELYTIGLNFYIRYLILVSRFCTKAFRGNASSA